MTSKEITRGLSVALVPAAAAGYIRMLFRTMKIRHFGLEHIEELNRAGKAYIIAFWHSQLLLMVYARYKRPITVMISQHRDGELIARTISRFGVNTARGSTTRGGAAALRSMIETVSGGQNLAFTPDGPRGPARIAQPGVVLAAAKAHVPIVPIAMIADRRRLLDSWDHFQLPRLFSRGVFLYGEPMYVPAELSSATLDEWRKKLETQLNDLTDIGESKFEETFAQGKR